MPLYFFRIGHGKYAGIAELHDIADRHAAWAEMTKVCADIVEGITRDLQQDAEWQIELLDHSKKPVFRIRLVAETRE
jgi:hypothetical protein